MTTPDSEKYLLRWKGRALGPFTFVEITDQLQAGEISRLHQVQQRGGWMLLDDFLEKREVRSSAASRGAPTPAIAESERGSGAEPSPLAHLLPKEHRREVAPLTHPAAPRAPQPPLPPLAPGALPRTSRLAMAALILSFCNVIPYVLFVAWLPSLICGHLALARMKRDPALGGYGIAITALTITYFLLVVGATFGVLWLLHEKP